MVTVAHNAKILSKLRRIITMIPFSLLIAGCEHPILVEGLALESPLFGKLGGRSFSELCESDQLVTGIAMSEAKSWGCGLFTGCDCIDCHDYKPICSGGAHSNNREYLDFSVAHTPERYTAILSCPPNHVVVGVDVRSGHYIDSISLRCARLRVESAGNDDKVTHGDRAYTGYRTFYGDGMGGGGATFQCPAESAINAISGGADSSLHSLKLYCANVTIKHE